MESSRENCMIVGPTSVPLFFRRYASMCACVGSNLVFFLSSEDFQPLEERALLRCIPHMIAGVDQSTTTYF